MKHESFTVEQAVAAQRALRENLGLPSETFPIAAFVGMISDEIEQLHAAGRSSQQIAAIIEASIGRTVNAADLDRFYAPPEQRR